MVKFDLYTEEKSSDTVLESKLLQARKNTNWKEKHEIHGAKLKVSAINMISVIYKTYFITGVAIRFVGTCHDLAFAFHITTTYRYMYYLSYRLSVLNV